MKCSLTSGSGYCWDDSWSLVHHWAGLHNKQDLGTRTHQSLGWWCLKSGCFSCSSTFLVPCTNLACWSLNWGNCQWMQSNPINDINVNDEVDVDIVGVDTHYTCQPAEGILWSKISCKTKIPTCIGKHRWIWLADLNISHLKDLFSLLAGKAYETWMGSDSDCWTE